MQTFYFLRCTADKVFFVNCVKLILCSMKFSYFAWTYVSEGNKYSQRTHKLRKLIFKNRYIKTPYKRKQLKKGIIL
jgi:hypothetical protein